MRTAVITGGAQGIGAAVARKFLADGFSGVLLVDRNQQKLEATQKHLGKGAEIFAGDLREHATITGAVAKAIKSFGRVDVLVNAAGNTERCGVADTTPEAFDRLFDVNVKAPLLMMQEAAKHMVAAKSGVIINIASMLAHGGPPNLATYSASKAALMTLSRNAANTFKRDGVRVFCVNLGWALTDGEHELQTGFHKLPQDWAEQIGARMPFGRLITADDVAGLCAFLVSPPAQMMTGAVIDYEQMPVGTFDSHPALSP
ncbi:MAG TPA: oxidoreductase [Aestuariivirga sp.]|jgi:NAD(P)-dependent dehydrogenase (short-subunit alcohol dehydrogenase family)|nr:oxidoreductase [Aestuariivirga sp.]